MQSNVTLYNADCLDILPTLADDSVDAVVTSPPYNLGNSKKGSFYQGQSKGERISYNTHNDNMDANCYIKWQHSVIHELYRLIGESGVIFYNHKPRILGGIYDNRRNLIPYPIRQEIVWDRRCMVNFNGSFFAPSTERIFVIAKSGWKPNKKYVGLGEVWAISPEHRPEHPAPFPHKLASTLVLSGSNEGDTILDPFMGSGTTGVACVQTGRNFIGIEIDEGYYNIAQKRIEEAQMQPRLVEA